MTATITSKGQITIPIKIRRKLGLRAGQKLEFDESASCLKAEKVVGKNPFDSVLGSLKGEMAGMSSQEYLDMMRGRTGRPRRKK